MKHFIILLLIFTILVQVAYAQVKVYKGTSSYTSDIEFNFDEKLTVEEFVAVWYAVKYCY